ncbi:MAG: hypothetical protein PHS73_01850 [Candidatus Peribacteraceae bacterium]|nr:hypothetical protein [Candidatus Peribacteraceae bacterium]
MGHEVDFIRVGEKSRSGDAIALRFGNLHGQRDEQFIIVIDGGTQQSGEELVTHIEQHYGTDTVDLAISTHPDADHSVGLRVVLEKMKVKKLWMHKPWEHAEDIRELFLNPRLTDVSLRTTLQKSLDNARDLITIAREKNIPIEEPFSDDNLGIPGLWVLGPSREYYQSLLPHFRDTPEASAEPGLLRKTAQIVTEAVMRWLDETWDIETLIDPTEEENLRSAENNSSVILLVRTNDGKHMLFTGDAAVPALTLAADRAQALGFDLPNQIELVQIPHHGSRHNVGPTILDRILGPKRQQPANPKTATVSAAVEGEPKHPSKKVTNAFQRRGCVVQATQGKSKCLPHNAPPRAGWEAAQPLPFYEKVEE